MYISKKLLHLFTYLFTVIYLEPLEYRIEEIIITIETIEKSIEELRCTSTEDIKMIEEGVQVKLT